MTDYPHCCTNGRVCALALPCRNRTRAGVYSKRTIGCECLSHTVVVLVPALQRSVAVFLGREEIPDKQKLEDATHAAADTELAWVLIAQRRPPQAPAKQT